MGNDETSDLKEVPELFARSAAAVWRALGEDEGDISLAEALDRELAALSPLERVVALAIASPSEDCEREARFDATLGRLSWIAGARALVSLALPRVAGKVQPREAAASLTESLWGEWLGAPPERRFVLALMWALLGRLPLAIDSGELVLELAQGLPPHEPEEASAAREDEDGLSQLPWRRRAPLAELEHEPVVALAVARAAACGDPGAQELVRDLLASAYTTAETAMLLLAGLGDGRVVPGMWRLMRLARAALSEDASWGRAVLGGVAALTDHTFELGTLVPADLIFEALCLMSDAEDVGATLADLPETRRLEVYRVVHARFDACPPPVRAALAQALLLGRVDSLGERLQAPGALLRERSTQVLLLVLGLLERVADAVPQDVKATLGRAYSDHPDQAVRKALAEAIPLRLGGGALREPNPGDVIALPPRALARDDLDRLRVAIWAGESERVIELASCVPLDRRAAARETLLESLEIPNAPLRRALVEAVGRIGAQSDAPRLVEAARQYRALEGTVASALRALNARAAAQSLAEIYKRRLKWADDEAVDDYCAIAGGEQVLYLREALETRFYPSARAGAARAIARHKVHEVVFALRAAALSDPQEPSRLAALSALMKLTGSSPSAGEIAGYAVAFRPSDELEDAIERAREAGTAALAGIRRTLLRGSWKRRRAACEVLATMPGEEAQGVLLGALEDPDEDVRLAALEALVQRGWQPEDARGRTLRALAARRLRELSLEPQAIDAETLVSALALGGHVFRAEVLEVLMGLDPEALPEGVLAWVAAARGDVAVAARYAGGLTAVFRAADHTWQANPHRARYVRGLAEVSTFAVAEALEGPRDDWSWRAREAQAQALFRFEAEDEAERARAIERLAELAREDDDDVRRAALTSLVMWGTLEAAEAIGGALVSPFQEDRELAARALGRVGPVALPVIERLMVDGWWESRQGAAVALGQWRTEVQVAVDRLIVLAVDAEYRVAQIAREALAQHGLLPTTAGVVRAVERAQALTVEGLEPWLGLHRKPTAEPEVAHALDVMLERTPLDALPQRLGLIALFRAEHLALWLEQVALGEPPDGVDGPGAHRHLGCRLAAADTLRALSRRACRVCQGERTVRCPGCSGAGEVACPDCAGKGLVMVACPDPGCTAHGTLRRIDSPRCSTCRGRGEVQAACGCEGGRGRTGCGLCGSSGRLGCAACEGTGEAHFD